MAHEGRADPVDAHVLRAARLVVRPHLLADHGLLPHRRAAPAELLRPRHAQQAAFGEQPAECLGHRQVFWVVGEGPKEVLRHVRFHQLPQVVTQRRGLPTHLEVHPLIVEQSL